jgi:hypothetical protein
VGVPHVAEGVYQVQGQKGFPGVKEGVPGAGIGESTGCSGRWTERQSTRCTAGSTRCRDRREYWVQLEWQDSYNGSPTLFRVPFP